MDPLLADPATCEVQSVICFLNAERVLPVDIHQHLTFIYGDMMNPHNARTWCAEFLSGRKNVHEEGRGRGPSIDDELVRRTDKKVCENQHLTIHELAILVPDISKSSIHMILTNKLGYTKMCALWVLKMLTEYHKRNRVDVLMNFWIILPTEEKRFYTGTKHFTKDSIVIGDKTWVYHLILKSKR